MVNGKLEFASAADQVRYQRFLSNLKEGDIVEEFTEIRGNNATVAQIARIHAMLRELSAYTGHGFEELKSMVKERTGLVVHKVEDEKEIYELKSFAYCSRQELSQAIDACIHLGELFNCQLA